jgi:hypothetical protein
LIQRYHRHRKKNSMYHTRLNIIYMHLHYKDIGITSLSGARPLAPPIYN